MTLKKLIYDLLVSDKQYRNSDRKLIWQVWEIRNCVYFGTMSAEAFWKAPSPETIRRCRQNLQRSDKLMGYNLIQPDPSVKKNRDKLAKEKGYSFIQGNFI